MICVTEGGETSSVIGTILTALAQWGQPEEVAQGIVTGETITCDKDEVTEGEAKESAKHLFFVYNNPDQALLPFDRSRRVLTESGITKINLATGPQSITGSTRMQATSSETYLVAAILLSAVGESHCSRDGCPGSVQRED